MTQELYAFADDKFAIITRQKVWREL